MHFYTIYSYHSFSLFQALPEHPNLHTYPVPHLFKNLSLFKKQTKKHIRPPNQENHTQNKKIVIIKPRKLVTLIIILEQNIQSPLLPISET